MDFELVGEITEVKTIARGGGVRDRARLRKLYGGARWRKVKGVARVRLPNGRNAWLRFIGMNRTGLEKENSN